MSWSPSDPPLDSQPASRRRVARYPLLPGLIIGAWFSAVIALVVGGMLHQGDLDRARTDFIAVRRAQSAAIALQAPVLRRSVARDDATRAAELAPGNEQVLTTAAAVLVQLGEYAAARPVLERQAELAPGRRDTQTQMELGLCYAMTGDAEQGGRLLEEMARSAYELQQLGAPEAAYATTLNNVAYDLALADLSLGQAERYATAAVAARPLEPNFIDTLGWVYFQSGDYEQAVFYLERAARLALPETNAEVEYHLGAAYAKAGQLAQASWRLHRAAKLDPENGRIDDELQRLRWDLPSPMMAELAE
jgi:tetratricopeptide (TPR) repeat protein